MVQTKGRGQTCATQAPTSPFGPTQQQQCRSFDKLECYVLMYKKSTCKFALFDATQRVEILSNGAFLFL